MTMIKQILASFFFLAISLTSARAGETEALKADLLLGTWDVSLFYSAEAPPSSTVMVFSKITDEGVTGSFYGTSFSTAQVTVRKGAVVFGAVTADGTGPYYHAGRLTEEGRIVGQTLSIGRNFVMAWEATKRVSEPSE